MSKLLFSKTCPPVVSLFCLSTLPKKVLQRIQVCCVDEVTEPEFHYVPEESASSSSSVQVLRGADIVLARGLFSVLPLSQELLHGHDPEHRLECRTQIESLVDLTIQLTHETVLVPREKTLSDFHLQFLKSFAQYLEFRTFCVHHFLSLADITLYTYIGKLTGFPMQLNGQDNLKLDLHIQRWWNHISKLNKTNSKHLKIIQTSYPGVISKKPSQRFNPSPQSHLGSEGKVQQDQNKSYQGKLPGAIQGQVVVRFPPEPSGYLHIGHAKAALINDYYARLYGGQLILRFDDTNPAKESMEFEDSILEDLQLLDIKPDKITHTSDYFDYFMDLCTQMIQKGHFYVDDTPVDQMRMERMEGIESVKRCNTVEQNLLDWDEMKQGTVRGMNCCVRSKMDMKNPNKCLRDPVMYRCIPHIPHHVHGFRYKVYPTYDFACPVVDSREGVTHAMRTNEYADRIPQYKWVLKQTGLRDVYIYEFSRLNFVNTVLSKRKLQWFVDQGFVTSWEDPRFPTVRGIRRRGLTVDALREFVLEQGPSKNCNLMEWDKLWTKNKQILDPQVPRYTAVDADTCVSTFISNGPEPPESKVRALHAKNASLGTTDMKISKEIWIEREDAETLQHNEEITLMHWCNALVESVERDESGIKSVQLRLHVDGDFKTTKKKIHWIATLSTEKVILREYDHLISKKKLEENDNLLDFCGHDSLFDTLAYADRNVVGLSQGSFVQFERRGYFRLDSLPIVSGDQTQPAVFIKIPDGRTKSMSVISSKVNEKSFCKGH